MVTEIVYRLYFRRSLMWHARTTYDDGSVTETFALAPKTGWRR